MNKFNSVRNVVNCLRNLFTGNIYSKLLSLLISIVVWFVVVWSIDPDVTTLVKNVPTQFGSSESLVMRKLGLNIIDGNNLSATVYIKGNRNVVGVIEPDDISVVAPVNDITEAGTYELQLEADVKNQLYKDIEIAAIKPSVVKIKVDKVITKSIPVEVICNGVTVQDGYVLEKPVASVDVVTITGPEQDVEKIDKALIVCDVNKKLNKTLKTVENVVLNSSVLPDIDTKYINVDNEIITVTLPVLKKKILPVTVDFINLPQNFPIDEFEYVIDPSHIEIAGPEEEVDKRESINLAYVDIKNLYLDNQIEYSVNLPSNFVNIENIEKVKVNFNMQDMQSKVFSNVLIKVPYTLTDYDITVNSKKLSKVELVGKKDVISHVVSGDVVAEVEINDGEITVGQTTVPLKISVPGKGLIWAVGDYKSVITISNKK